MERPTAVGEGRLLARMVDSRVDGWVVGVTWGESRRRAYTLTEG